MLFAICQKIRHKIILVNIQKQTKSRESKMLGIITIYQRVLSLFSTKSYCEKNKQIELTCRAKDVSLFWTDLIKKVSWETSQPRYLLKKNPTRVRLKGFVSKTENEYIDPFQRTENLQYLNLRFEER